MSFTVWFILVGFLLISMALGASILKRLPLTTAMLYLAVGFGIGPFGLHLLDVRPEDQTRLLEVLTEIAVIVSLFTAGLKLRVPWRDAAWRLPVALAFGSMALTVGLIALLGWSGLGLSIGAAILLGAVLAPTDPVLASDVQVNDPADQDRLRFTLTAEAGLNDGAAFPFVMLGLGLLGLRELGTWGWRWWTVDILWAIAGGLIIGALLGTAIGHLVIYLRRTYRGAIGLDDFLTLGLIALAYGAALLVHAYGFLAVFAAGSALRRIERQHGGDQSAAKIEQQFEQVAPKEAVERIARHPETAPAFLTRQLLGFNEQLERIGEVTVVVLVGAMLSFDDLPPHALWFIPALFLLIRPLAALVGSVGSGASLLQRGYISWFGIRGIGSIYYLMFAIEHGLPRPLAEQFIDLALLTVAVSIVVHGVSVTPLMNRYRKTEGRLERNAAAASE